MKKWIRQLLESFGLIPHADVIAQVSLDYPDAAALKAGVLHVVGGKNYWKWAYFKCPCGCGAPIMLSLSRTQRPSWRISIDWLDRPTIDPSVWQTDGCSSHFFLKQGRIEWVKDNTRNPRRRAFGPPVV